VSIGVTYEWSDDEHDLTLIRPAELNLDDMDIEAARRTRSADGGQHLKNAVNLLDVGDTA
jgi:hypothetical protein